MLEAFFPAAFLDVVFLDVVFLEAAFFAAGFFEIGFLAGFFVTAFFGVLLTRSPSHAQYSSSTPRTLSLRTDTASTSSRMRFDHAAGDGAVILSLSFSFFIGPTYTIKIRVGKALSIMSVKNIFLNINRREQKFKTTKWKTMATVIRRMKA